jgi:hypothetical protein
MVRINVPDDPREKADASRFPWWWKQKDHPAIKSVLKDAQTRWNAFRYEAGRRHLIRTEGKKSEELRPLSDWFTADIERNELVINPLKDPRMPESGFPMPTMVSPPGFPPLTDDDIAFFGGGSYERVQAIWDLEAPWSSVAKHLKWLFDESRKIREIQNTTKLGGFQMPSWTKIEHWDLWEADEALPEGTFPEGGGISHQRVTQRAAKDATRYAEYATNVAATISQL